VGGLLSWEMPSILFQSGGELIFNYLIQQAEANEDEDLIQQLRPFTIYDALVKLLGFP
jgi:hypothetical protein